MAMGQGGSRSYLSEFSLTGENLYIYCVKLPFTCDSFHQSLPAPFDQLLQVPQYSMVKVGISKEPAQRLCTIMNAFKEFGAQDTQFHYLRENDSP